MSTPIDEGRQARRALFDSALELQVLILVRGVACFFAGCETEPSVDSCLFRSAVVVLVSKEPGLLIAKDQNRYISYPIKSVIGLSDM